MTLFHYFSVYPEVISKIFLDLFLLLTFSKEKINHTNPTENISACLVQLLPPAVEILCRCHSVPCCVLLTGSSLSKWGLCNMFWQCMFFCIFISHGSFPGIVLERVARDLGPSALAWGQVWREIAGRISPLWSSVWGANFVLVPPRICCFFEPPPVPLKWLVPDHCKGYHNLVISLQWFLGQQMVAGPMGITLPCWLPVSFSSLPAAP